MNEVNLDIINNLPEDGDKFIRLFIRFEYSLKAMGFARTQNGDAALPDWNTFSKEVLRQEFFDRVEADDLMPTLLNNPPSKQIFSDGTLDWQATMPPTNIQSLAEAVKRVRNNLFHGGKAGDQDSNRNNELVNESILFLLEAIAVDKAFRITFENYQ